MDRTKPIRRFLRKAAVAWSKRAVVAAQRLKSLPPPTYWLQAPRQTTIDGFNRTARFIRRAVRASLERALGAAAIVSGVLLSPSRFFRHVWRGLGRTERTPARRIVVALSGHVRSGKSAIADELQARVGAHVVRTKDVLIAEYGATPEARGARRRLQDLGELLDIETRGQWVSSAVMRATRSLRSDQVVVVDAVRIPRQVELLHANSFFFVIPVHLDATREVLEERYLASGAGSDVEVGTYEELLESRTEANISVMREGARIRLNTGWLPEGITLNAVVLALHLVRAWLALRHLPRAFAVGTPVAALLVMPEIWFVASSGASRPLVFTLAALSATFFVLASTLIGAAVTQLSPIERDPAGY
jgi:predicted kinase